MEKRRQERKRKAEMRAVAKEALEGPAGETEGNKKRRVRPTKPKGGDPHPRDPDKRWCSSGAQWCSTTAVEWVGKSCRTHKVRKQETTKRRQQNEQRGAMLMEQRRAIQGMLELSNYPLRQDGALEEEERALGDGVANEPTQASFPICGQDMRN